MWDYYYCFFLKKYCMQLLVFDYIHLGDNVVLGTFRLCCYPTRSWCWKWCRLILIWSARFLALFQDSTNFCGFIIDFLEPSWTVSSILLLGSGRPLHANNAFSFTFKGPGKLCAPVTVIVAAPSHQLVILVLSICGDRFLQVTTGDAFLVLDWKTLDENSCERFPFSGCNCGRRWHDQKFHFTWCHRRVSTTSNKSERENNSTCLPPAPPRSSSVI